MEYYFEILKLLQPLKYIFVFSPQQHFLWSIWTTTLVNNTKRRKLLARSKELFFIIQSQHLNSDIKLIICSTKKNFNITMTSHLDWIKHIHVYLVKSSTILTIYDFLSKVGTLKGPDINMDQIKITNTRRCTTRKL